MAKINTLNYQPLSVWDGDDDLFIVQQVDDTKVATPDQLKQYVLGNSIDDIYSVMGQNGAKNLISYPYYRSSGYVHRSVTYTVDNNGKITANGTATGGNSYFEMRNAAYETFNLKPNTRYIISGCPSGGGDSTYSLAVSYNVGGGSSTALASDFGNGAEFTTPQNANANYTILVKIISGTATTNLLFEPMLRLASDTDDTYQPYAKTNKELTDEIGDLSQTGLTGDSVAEQLETALNQIIGLQTSKLTLVESKATSSGDSLTFDTTLQNDTMYLVAMSAPVSAASRRMRCSMIRTVDTTTNEIYFGSPDFTVSVSALKLSIICSEVRYGLRATLIKLM